MVSQKLSKSTSHNFSLSLALLKNMAYKYLKIARSLSCCLFTGNFFEQPQDLELPLFKFSAFVIRSFPQSHLQIYLSFPLLSLSFDFSIASNVPNLLPVRLISFGLNI